MTHRLELKFSKIDYASNLIFKKYPISLLLLTRYLLFFFPFQRFMKVEELKKSMGWLRFGSYCIRCAIKDGWEKAEVCITLH